MRHAALLALLALGACSDLSGPPLVSAQFPPATAAAHAEPQPANALPPGAANFSTAPGALEPNYLSRAFRL